jgi:hypothetical protein
VAGPEQIDLAVRIARLEILQGVVSVDGEERNALYYSFGPEESSWEDMAATAYRAMASIGGTVATIGDELLAELDIRSNLRLWATTAGWDEESFLAGAGTWWSPSANWFYRGREVLEAAQFSNPSEIAEEFEVFAQALLLMGANALASLYASVVDGAERLLGEIPKRRKRERADLALIGEVARQRGLLFLRGPDPSGRFFTDESPLTQADVEAALERQVKTARNGRRQPQPAFVSHERDGGAAV